MIFTISTPDKISLIFPLIQKFCKRANAGYKAGELAQWLRLNVENPLVGLIVHKKDKDSKIDGFGVAFITQDIMKPIVFVQNVYSQGDGTEEIYTHIINWGLEQGVYNFRFDTMIPPAKMEELMKKFEITQECKLKSYIWNLSFEEE